MKFLCPQCKAKYRIADEKLATRASSKMKCRKCGHVIDIHTAAVPESIMPPPGGPGAHADAEEEADRESRESTTGGPPRTSVPRVMPAAVPKRSPIGSPPAAKRPAVQPAKRAAAPPRRGGAAVAQAVAESPTPDEQGAYDAKPAAPPRTAYAEDQDEPTRIHDGGALSAAFGGFGMGAAISAAPQQAPGVPDEWYVGIDGSPVGPLTFGQLREKASAGKANLESLVWKDGFEDWKPLSAFPELVALVEEAKQPPTSPMAAPVPVAPIEPRIIVSEPPGEILEELGVKRKRPAGNHMAAWIAIGVAMAFGVTIGVVFLKPKDKEIVKYIEVPAQTARANDDQAPSDPGNVIEEQTVQPGGAPRKSTGTGTGKTDTAAPVSSSKGLLNGLNGLNGLGPAKGSGPDVSQGAAAGGQLDGTAIQRVVSNFTPSVRRGCWQPALEGRAPDAPSSARVGLTITVAPSGRVENVTTTGDPKGYPGLSRCIQSKVQSWNFPRSSSPTTVNVPFVFAAQ